MRLSLVVQLSQAVLHFNLNSTTDASHIDPLEQTQPDCNKHTHTQKKRQTDRHIYPLLFTLIRGKRRERKINTYGETKRAKKEKKRKMEREVRRHETRKKSKGNKKETAENQGKYMKQKVNKKGERREGKKREDAYLGQDEQRWKGKKEKQRGEEK